ncbi:MAG: hypothetical protein KA354_13690 [Phycisphaerae bacterium]|nr:hypothetical protein [Phycisphaerae bacterium]
MSTLRERIEVRLQERVGCILSEAGNRLPADAFNTLFARLDEVIRIVAQIRDFSTEPYYQRLREVVCARCREDDQGRCIRREEGECGLDEYFPTIVAIIEQEFKADVG